MVSFSPRTDGFSLTVLGKWHDLHCQHHLTDSLQLRPTPDHCLRCEPSQAYDREMEQLRTEHHQETHEGYALWSRHNLELVIPS